MKCLKRVIDEGKSAYVAKYNPDSCTNSIKIWYLVYIFILLLRCLISVK